MSKKNGAVESPHAELAAVWAHYSQIRHAADSAVRFEIERVRERHPAASEPELQRIVANACRPFRNDESAALARLAESLSAEARELLFKETLDTHFMPRRIAEKVPPALAGVL